jgi:hypothetical protein
MAEPTLIMPYGRAQAHRWINAAPDDVIVTFKKPKRTLPQNARLWAMLTDVANQATHAGQRFSPEQWKCLFMAACGHETEVLPGLSGGWFPAGFRSSKMTKEQMGELMDWIEAWCAENGVRLAS